MCFTFLMFLLNISQSDMKAQKMPHNFRLEFISSVNPGEKQNKENNSKNKCLHLLTLVLSWEL